MALEGLYRRGDLEEWVVGFVKMVLVVDVDDDRFHCLLEEGWIAVRSLVK